MGKVKALKLLEKSHERRQKISVFGRIDTTKNIIAEIGCQFIGHLYTISLDLTLSQIRYQQFITPKFIPLERGPVLVQDSTLKNGASHWWTTK